jgi:signal transduction histidine kinase
MLMFSSTDATTQLIVTFLGQFVLGIILFLIFNHFSKVYVRRFLKLWSRSWLAFALYMLNNAALVQIYASGQYEVFGLSASFLAQVGCFLQLAFILMGTYQLVQAKPIKKRAQALILISVVAFALLIVLLYAHAPEEAAIRIRYTLRVGSRTLIIGLGFLVTGLVVGLHPKLAGGMGQKLLALSFLLAFADQMFYSAVLIMNVLGSRYRVPVYFGLIDMVLITMIGISMVMWLLEDERDKLRKANQELDSFLYSTSHDLRAPIASILGLTYLGKVELQEEQARVFMQMIEDRVKKLDMVIGDILSLSRTKKFDVKIDTIDFSALLEETITDLKFNKGASAIELRYDRAAQHVFRSDYNQLKIVLSNLIANALKYHNLAQDRPFIRVGFRLVADRVEIEVEDNGTGIPEESISRVFDMFYRASLTTEGTGLGLYIVREALSKINGSIAVRSTYGRGSTFTVQVENPAPVSLL